MRLCICATPEEVDRLAALHEAWADRGLDARVLSLDPFTRAGATAAGFEHGLPIEELRPLVDDELDLGRSVQGALEVWRGTTSIETIVIAGEHPLLEALLTTARREGILTVRLQDRMWPDGDGMAPGAMGEDLVLVWGPATASAMTATTLVAGKVEAVGLPAIPARPALEAVVQERAQGRPVILLDLQNSELEERGRWIDALSQIALVVGTNALDMQEPGWAFPDGAARLMQAADAVVTDSEAIAQLAALEGLGLFAPVDVEWSVPGLQLLTPGEFAAEHGHVESLQSRIAQQATQRGSWRAEIAPLRGPAVTDAIEAAIETAMRRAAPPRKDILSVVLVDDAAQAHAMAKRMEREVTSVCFLDMSGSGLDADETEGLSLVRVGHPDLSAMLGGALATSEAPFVAITDGRVDPRPRALGVMARHLEREPAAIGVVGSVAIVDEAGVEMARQGPGQEFEAALREIAGVYRREAIAKLPDGTVTGLGARLLEAGLSIQMEMVVLGLGADTLEAVVRRAHGSAIDASEAPALSVLIPTEVGEDPSPVLRSLAKEAGIAPNFEVLIGEAFQVSGCADLRWPFPVRALAGQDGVPGWLAHAANQAKAQRCLVLAPRVDIEEGTIRAHAGAGPAVRAASRMPALGSSKTALGVWLERCRATARDPRMGVQAIGHRLPLSCTSLSTASLRRSVAATEPTLGREASELAIGREIAQSGTPIVTDWGPEVRESDAPDVAQIASRRSRLMRELVGWLPHHPEVLDLPGWRWLAGASLEKTRHELGTLEARRESLEEAMRDLGRLPSGEWRSLGSPLSELAAQVDDSLAALLGELDGIWWRRGLVAGLEETGREDLGSSLAAHPLPLAKARGERLLTWIEDPQRGAAAIAAALSELGNDAAQQELLVVCDPLQEQTVERFVDELAARLAVSGQPTPVGLSVVRRRTYAPEEDRFLCAAQDFVFASGRGDARRLERAKALKRRVHTPRLPQPFSLATEAAFRVLTWPDWRSEEALTETLNRFGKPLVGSSAAALLLRHDPAADPDLADCLGRLEGAVKRSELEDDPDLEILLIDDTIDTEGLAALGHAVTVHAESPGVERKEWSLGLGARVIRTQDELNSLLETAAGCQSKLMAERIEESLPGVISATRSRDSRSASAEMREISSREES